MAHNIEDNMTYCLRVGEGLDGPLLFCGGQKRAEALATMTMERLDYLGSRIEMDKCSWQSWSRVRLISQRQHPLFFLALIFPKFKQRTKRGTK